MTTRKSKMAHPAPRYGAVIHTAVEAALDDSVRGSGSGVAAAVLPSVPVASPPPPPLLPALPLDPALAVDERDGGEGRGAGGAERNRAIVPGVLDSQRTREEELNTTVLTSPRTHPPD